MYSIDTSSLIQGWNVLYPIDVFPGVWLALERLISSGKLVASELVLDELRKKSDGVTAWANAHTDMFVEMDKVQNDEAKRIITGFPRLIDERPGRNQADPFVIALAKHRGITCVTEENHGSDKQVRIPYVCDKLSVRCIRLVELLRDESFLLSLDDRHSGT